MAKKPQCPQFVHDLAMGGEPYGYDAKFIFSNWLKIHAFIRKVPNSREGMCTLAKLIAAEYMRRPGPRMDIVTRLYGKLSRVRYEVERVELGTRNTR